METQIGTLAMLAQGHLLARAGAGCLGCKVATSDAQDLAACTLLSVPPVYTLLYVPSVFVLVADAGVYAQQSEGAGTVRSRQGHLLRVAHLVHTLAPSPPPPQRSFPAAREHHQEVLEIRT